MIKEIEKHLADLEKIKLKNLDDVESFRIKYISKKGIVPYMFSQLKDVPNKDKREVGLQINSVKQKVNEIISLHKEKFKTNKSNDSFEDLTKPAEFLKLGSRHPISIVKNKIIDIFLKIGFDISEGPEIEDDWHNFTALNLPEHHPARDMQDTFYLNKNPDWLLRTHTSSVQIRHMENNEPPIRTISPGRVYRNEDISARSHCFFHQVEGLYIDEGVSFVDLKHLGEISSIRDSQGDCYFCDLSIQVMKPSCFEDMDNGKQPFKWQGKRSKAIEVDFGFDIDTEWQYVVIEFWLKQRGFTALEVPWRKKRLNHYA